MSEISSLIGKSCELNITFKIISKLEEASTTLKTLKNIAVQEKDYKEIKIIDDLQNNISNEIMFYKRKLQ